MKQIYIGYNLNENERQRSTSGGIFIVLAKSILEQDGVVFGATLNSNNEVVHSEASSLKTLELLIGSKYVQSYKGQVFLQVKKYLNEGKLVMFSGTPCEVLGLKKYLKKDYDSLFLVDLLCHGVPSPKVWAKYLREKGVDTEAGISYRSKISGWLKSSITIETATYKYESIGENDPYISLFNSGLSMRPSCFNCKIKGIENKQSDITLGDFWGVTTIRPELFDNRGISLIFCNTAKGKKILEQLKKNLYLEEISKAEILYENGDIGKPMSRPKTREKFFEEVYTEVSLSTLKNKYVRIPIKTKMIHIVKIFLRKVGAFDFLKRLYRKIK